METNVLSALFDYLAGISDSLLSIRKDTTASELLFISPKQRRVLLLQNDYGNREGLVWCPDLFLWDRCETLWHKEGTEGAYIDIRSPDSVKILEKVIRDYLVSRSTY